MSGGADAAVHTVRRFVEALDVEMSGTHSDSNGRTVKSVAVDFCNVWRSSSQQLILTALMADMTLMQQEQQQLFQKTSLILLGLLTVRDSAPRKLNIVSKYSMPDSHEENTVASLTDT